MANLASVNCGPQFAPLNPRTREECIEKYNQIARRSALAAATSNGTAATKVTASPTETESTAAAVVSAVGAAATNGVSCNDVADTADVWTPEQDQLLQDALAKFPASMEKNDRWTAIAGAVPGKTKKACVNRFKAIREALKNKK